MPIVCPLLKREVPLSGMLYFSVEKGLKHEQQPAAQSVPAIREESAYLG